VRQLYANVPVLDTAARGSTTTFVQRGIGDVLPPVAVVDKVVDAKGTRKVAEAYLNFLYTPEAQKIIAKNYYRPSDPKSADPEDLKRFPDVKLVTIDDPLFGGWKEAQPKHFADGGLFDQIYQPKSTN
jgi:sulfate transport system substrate-binding protein